MTTTLVTDAELTRDEILRGGLCVWQPRKGYRFTLDPLLLVDFAAELAADTLCDLCTGVGIVALAALKARPNARGVAVELQPRLKQLAERNAAENALADRLRVLELDLADDAATRAALPGAQFELVLSNPPYRAQGRGPVSVHDESAIARHELRLTLGELVKQARRILQPGGHFAVVYPPDRLPELLHTLAHENLQPRVLRLAHAKANDPAYLALVLTAQKGSNAPLRVDPSLIVYNDDGTYSAEANRILGVG